MSDKRVQLFVTCIVETLTPDIGLAAAKVLERLGVAVMVPEGLTCCGQPAFNGGFWDDARAMARRTIDVLSKHDAPVVTERKIFGLVRNIDVDKLARRFNTEAYISRVEWL